MSFDPTKLGAQYTYKVSSVTIPGAGANARLVTANPYRVAIFITSSTAQSYLGISQAVNQSNGIGIPTNTFQLFSLATSGPFCQQELWAQTTSAGSVYGITEVLWLPPGE